MALTGRERSRLPRAAAAATALMVAATLLPIGVGRALAANDRTPSSSPARVEETAWSPTSYTRSAAARPNIVMILLDDVGAHDGRIWSRLPTISQTFVEQGTRFSNFSVETPSCTPSRATFLTGLHTHRHRVTRNHGPLFKPGMSLATQLKKSGYHTILSGKYLNNMKSRLAKKPKGWTDFRAYDGGYYDYSMWLNGKRREYGRAEADYSTDVIAGHAVKAIAAAPSNKPVFTWIAPYAPHSSIVPAPRHKGSDRCDGVGKWWQPSFNERWVADKPAYIRKRKLLSVDGFALGSTCRTLLAVDDLLRDVRAELQRQGRLDDTLFILTADNGMNYGMHRMLYSKFTPFATDVPFYAAWTAAMGTGSRKVTQRIMNIDVAPTLCELAGCRLGPYPTGQRAPDGRSFAPLLKGGKKSLKRKSVLMSFRRDDNKSVPRWWAVETTSRSGLAWKGCSARKSGGCRWQYVRYETGETELYDLSRGPCRSWRWGQAGDPCRLENLAGKQKYQGLRKALEEELAKARSR